MSSVRKSVVISSVSSLLSKLIGFLSVIMVARLLSPDEIGVYVISASLMMLASELSMLGTTNYIIREKKLTLQKIESCLAISIIISWGIGLIVLSSSSLISSFYGIDDLVYLIAILCIPYALNPFTSVTTTLLSKEFEYGRFMAIEIAGSVTSLVTTVILILLDFSYFSMAIGEALSAIIKCAFAYFLRLQGVTWKAKLHDVKPILSVGIYTSLINIVTRMEFNIADLILGRIATPSFVATTSRAIGLHVFIKDILGNGIARVAMPYLAVSAADKNKLKTSFLDGNNLALAFIAPPIAVAAVAAEPLINLFFGDQWSASVPIAQALGAWMVVKTLISFSRQGLILVHAEKALLLARVVALISLAVAIYLCVSKFDLNLGVAFFAYSIFDLILTLLLLKRFMCIDTVAFFTSIKKSLVLIALCFISALGLNVLLGGFNNDVLLIVAYGVVMTPIWLLGLYFLKHPLWTHISDIPVLTTIVNKFKKA